MSERYIECYEDVGNGTTRRIRRINIDDELDADQTALDSKADAVQAEHIAPITDSAIDPATESAINNIIAALISAGIIASS